MPPRYQLAAIDAVTWLRSLPADSADLLITEVFLECKQFIKKPSDASEWQTTLQ